MAITKVHYAFLKHLRQKNLIPTFDSILEIGEQNWYGDLPPEILFKDIKQFCDNSVQEELIIKLDSHIKNYPYDDFLFDVAKIFYQIFFRPKTLHSIDLHGTSRSMRLDLNREHKLEIKYDCIINLGTAEHIFNVAQLFRSIHEWIKIDGLFIHNLPMSGEIDHGFYNFHPTFFWDLSYINKYENIIMAKSVGNDIKVYTNRKSFTKDILTMESNISSGIWSIQKKTDSSKEFKIPLQGVYDDNLPNTEIKESWIKHRKITDENSGL